MFQQIFKGNPLQKIVRSLHIQKTNVGVVSVPFDKGQKKSGAALGPRALIDGGLIEKLRGLHEKMDVKQYRDVEYNMATENTTVPNMTNYAHIPACNYELSKTVEQIIREGRICLTLGGDHSIGIGSVNGHLKAKEEVCVLWVDAHCDLNTNETSETGNIHGMPVALLVSELENFWQKLPGMDWCKPKLSLKNVAYIGLRSVDPYERLFIDKFGITAFGMEDIDRLGIRNVVSLALNKIDPNGNRSIHVSFDIDSLDRLEAPSTILPIGGGLTLREGMQIMETVHETGRLGAMDLVEIDPTIGTEKDVQRTVDSGLHLILAAFGNRRSGLISKELQLKQHTNQNN